MAIPKTAPRTILLVGKEYSIMKELIAAGTITPGHLVAINSAGKWAVHGTAKGRAMKAFAAEADLIGKGIDDNYVANDNVYVWIVPAGAEINALVAASATAITVGALLESAGDGTLRVLTADNTTGPVFGGYPIAQALEAVDNSGGATPARIKVIVL